ncbi:MAG TPA: FAD-dependent oxidoreductase [Acidimicrobiia bacterium]|nr:FAD-dependent oxidoreductase [Acidimicrobiia bacterium]
MKTADVVVCGAGIAGVATAYHLVKRGAGRVILVDPRPPLTLTSDKSTECYRNWWPNAAMVGLMNRSIDLLQGLAAESGDAFNLGRRGYLYVTADEARLTRLREEGAATSKLGGGELRIQRDGGYQPNGPDAPADGADLFIGGDLLRRHFPFVTPAAQGALHVRRAGWFSAQQLGAWMLERAFARGLQLIPDAVVSVGTSREAVSGVTLDSGEEIAAPVFINAAGPMVARVSAMIGVELPVYSEVHIKVAFRDHLGVIPRDAPMFIWCDPQRIPWSAEERRLLEEDGRAELVGEMPASCHARPEGGAGSQWLVGLWEYHRTIQEPTWPLPEDPLYPEVVIRGLQTMAPGLARYLDHLPQPMVDGGYYTKTRENRPLVGPLPLAGAFVVGAFSGFGVMAAAAAGELAALHVTGDPLPDYAPAFALSRYDDPAYLAEISQITDTGQI